MIALNDNNFAVISHSIGDCSVVFGAGKTNSSKNIVLERLNTVLDVAPWGEANRFPQDIVKAMEACGIGVATLNKKARSLWGVGLLYGKIIGWNGAEEIFEPAKLGDYPEVDAFWENNNIPRYFAEFNLDYVWFANCFPELVISNDGTKINKIVHQESADCRFKQMNDKGCIDTVYISKAWGYTSEQFVKFDNTKSILGLKSQQNKLTKIDNKYIQALPALDKYDPLQSLKQFVAKGKRNIIYPVDFPSPNKTYYQLASWDGAREAGWIEIASKIPSLLKSLYKNSFNIKYHIEIPEDYFSKRYGQQSWAEMSAIKKQEAREEVLSAMDEFLSGTENAYKSLITYFDINPINQTEYGGVKIKQLKNENQTENELLTSGTANSEIMISMGVNPNTYGAGKPGGVYASNQGGSNIREGMVEQETSLALDRQIGLEPFELIKRFNNWPQELVFRYKDTILTTLDKGGSTQQTIQ